MAAYTNTCDAGGYAQISQPLVPLVDEFAARLFGELDYVQEGRNAEKFQVCLSRTWFDCPYRRTLICSSTLRYQAIVP